MTSRPLRAAKRCGWLLLVCGCRHEGDAAPPLPSSASSLDAAASAEAPADAVASTEAGASSGPRAAVTAVTAVAADALDAATPPRPPAPDPLDSVVAPAYPPSALSDAFTAAKQRLVDCYAAGKKRDRNLRGKVMVKFTVNSDGMAKPVANEGSTLPDDGVVSCVVRVVRSLRFRKPIEGSATVVYPFIFRPTGGEALILPDVEGKSP